MRRVTLRQLAQHVGLSTFAVSRSLSGKPGVSEKTRRLVIDAAVRLGYAKPRPPAVRDIGLVFHDLDPINSELQVRMQSGVQREAQRLGWTVRMLWTHVPVEIADLGQSCAGLLLAGPHERATLESVKALDIPMVRLGWVDPLEQINQVTGTDHEGGQAVAQYLIDLGHRDIAYVHGNPGYRGRLERFWGMREVAERYADVTLRQMKFNEEGSFAEALHELRRSGADPTAYFCSHDGLAVTVMSELLGLGYRIPEDVSVVGFCDLALATQISPQLTTVRSEGAEIGVSAVRMLLEMIEGGWRSGSPARRVQIASRIIERRSSGPRSPEASSAFALARR